MAAWQGGEAFGGQQAPGGGPVNGIGGSGVEAFEQALHIKPGAADDHAGMAPVAAMAGAAARIAAR